MSTATAQRSGRATAIAAAALECFDERGFSATTVEDIRERSGASIGSIYHHFGRKEEIAAHIYVEGLRDYQEGALRALDANPEAQAGVRALIHHHLGWVSGNPPLARFLMNRRETELREATRVRVRDLNRRFFPRVAEWVERQVRAEALRALPLDLLEPVLLGPSQEFARAWLSGRTRTTIQSAEQDLAETTWRAVKGDRHDGT